MTPPPRAASITTLYRVSAISSHLSTTTKMSTPTRPPITCHVLDTVTGRPAAGVTVKLWCTHQQDIIFIANTNQDGRVAEWENKQGPGETTSDYVQNRGGVNATMCSVIERFAKREEGAQADSRCKCWGNLRTGAHI